MNLRTWLVGAVALVVLAAVSGQVFSQDKPAQPPSTGMPPEMQAAMEKWAEFAAPGEPHRDMAKRAGIWNAAVKMWWAGPDSPPTVTTGVSEVKVILDGRFITEKFRCEMKMGDQVMGYEGFGISGYDNFKRMYTSFWVDNMGTQMILMLGSQPPGSNKLTFYGQMDEPLLGVQDRMVKSVVTLVSEDEHVFEMYDLHVGENYKVMEITYTRAK